MLTDLHFFLYIQSWLKEAICLYGGAWSQSSLSSTIQAALCKKHVQKKKEFTPVRTLKDWFGSCLGISKQTKPQKQTRNTTKKNTDVIRYFQILSRNSTVEGRSQYRFSSRIQPHNFSENINSFHSSTFTSLLQALLHLPNASIKSFMDITQAPRFCSPHKNIDTLIIQAQQVMLFICWLYNLTYKQRHAEKGVCPSVLGLAHSGPGFALFILTVLNK